MGAWDQGPFGNDDAADWIFELAESQDPMDLALESLVAAAETDGYLEAPEGAAAVAAAAWVAGVETPVELPRPEADIRALAARALDRVAEPDSELIDLYEEAGEIDSFRTIVADLQERLRVADVTDASRPEPTRATGPAAESRRTDRGDDVPGQVLRFDLDDGTVVYGRRLRDASVGFYARRGTSISPPPPGSRDYAFVIPVHEHLVRSHRVTPLGVDPVLPGEDDWPPPYAISDITPGPRQIYDHGVIRPAVGDEWVGLEVAQVWGEQDVLARLAADIPVSD